MSFVKNIKSLDNKFSWSFFGFLIGILGFVYAIYVDQFRELKPRLIYDLLSNTQVLSVKEDVNKLDIIYDGQNLKQQKENLILLTIRIKNEGSANIKEVDYYSRISWGLKINGAKIAEKPQLIDASNKFLKDNVLLAFDSSNTIIINKIPIDEGQYFTIKVLTICNQSIFPSIIPIGKISGITNDFEIRNTYLTGSKEEKSFFDKLTYGSISVHIARFFFYLIVIILSVFIIAFPISKISTAVEERSKKRKVEKFRNKTRVTLTENIEVIFDMYKDEYGEDTIKQLNKILSDNKELAKCIKNIEDKTDERIFYDEFKELHRELYPESILRRGSLNKIISKLLDMKIISKQENQIIVDEQFKTELKEFNYFIEFQ